MIGIYPEGTLTRDPDLWPMVGKTGAARLALLTGDRAGLANDGSDAGKGAQIAGVAYLDARNIGEALHARVSIEFSEERFGCSTS